jgi:hypothetical protein
VKLFGATTAVWRYGGQEIIQSPAGTISQANTAQLAVACIIVCAGMFITFNFLNGLKIERWRLIILQTVTVIFFFCLLLKLCVLLPAIVL